MRSAGAPRVVALPTVPSELPTRLARAILGIDLQEVMHMPNGDSPMLGGLRIISGAR